MPPAYCNSQFRTLYGWFCRFKRSFCDTVESKICIKPREKEPCLRRTRVCIVPCQMALLGSLPGIWSRPRCRLAVCLILLIVHALSAAFHCRLISSEFRSCVKPWFRVNLNCQVFVLFVCKFTLREAEDLLSCIVEDYSWTFGCAPNKWNRTEQLCCGRDLSVIEVNWMCLQDENFVTSKTIHCSNSWLYGGNFKVNFRVN